MKIPSSELVVYKTKNVTPPQKTQKQQKQHEKQKQKQFVYTKCSDLALFMYWTHDSMNNLSSFCGLGDARISASDKDLPVHITKWKIE